MAGRITVIANNKGGVGKSTITFNLAGAISEIGPKVLLIDMDQQGSLSSTFLDNIHELPHTVTNILLDLDLPIEESIYPTRFQDIDLIPANLSLGRVEVELLGDQDAQYYLADRLEEVTETYDQVLIDSPPSLGLATRMVLVAAHDLIIPIECHAYTAKGTASFHELINRVRRRANPELNTLGYLINKYDGRRRIEQDYRKMLEEKFGDKIFNILVKNSVKYTESVALKTPITFYLPNSEQAEPFRILAKEILNCG